MLKRACFVLGIMFFLFPAFSQEADDESYLSDDESYLSDDELYLSDDESYLSDDGLYLSDDEPYLSDDEPYLSIEDQEAILDKTADAIIDATVNAEHKQDSQPVSDQYLVRIEIYSRMKTSYIPVGDLSLESGFFSWSHDGHRQNGYAVYMYPVNKNASRITRISGITLLYGKSFRSAEEAIAEIQKRGSAFNRLIRYRPVVDQMVKLLKKEPYQGVSR
jgi:hypothetical protein